MRYLNLNKRLYRLIAIASVLSVIYFILFASLQKIGSKDKIWLEAEDALVVKEPLQVIDMEGASNNKGIIAIGRHQHVEGFAKYNFSIEQDGTYIFWGRCFWPQVCSNAFLVTIDNSSYKILGENPITNQWHWLTGLSFDLKRGKHELTLWNNERDSRIDKFLITSDSYYIPSGFGLMNDIFLDFEDNLIPDFLILSNATSWQMIQEETGNKCLLLSKKAGFEEMLLLKMSKTDNYSCKLAYKSMGDINNKQFIFIDYADKLNYFLLELEKNKASLFKVANGQRSLLRQITSETPFINNEFDDIALKKVNTFYKIKHNGKMLFEFSDSSNIGSYFGVSSEKGDVYFDNIAIINDENVNYSENFHSTHPKFLNERPEVSMQYFDQLKRGKRNWWVISGKWNVLSDGFEALEGSSENGQEAKVLFGDVFWNNYTLNVATKINDEGDLGLLFNFQDTNNYYLFKWMKENNVWKHKLSKYQNGSETVLFEKESDILLSGKAYWYKLSLKLQDGLINVFVDNKPIVNVLDTTYKEGKVGFWTNCTKGSVFDDITVVATDDSNKGKKHNYEYSFGQNMEISMDYADWVPSIDGIIQNMEVVYEKAYTIVGLNKQILQTSRLSNKNVFYGDFKVEVSTSYIPLDIDVFLDFNSLDKRKDTYRLIISNEKVSLVKNNKLLSSNILEINNRRNIKVIHQNNSWKLELGGLKSFDYKDENKIDSVKIALGYSGIGKGKIFLNQILIEDYLH